jgi:hypothetical protein
MGWMFCEAWDSKAELIQHLTGPEVQGDYLKVIAKSVRGNVLWTVEEYTRDANGQKAGHRWIGCFLMGSNKRHGQGWGYKDMDESMGPCETSCPVKYFDMVPDPGGYATAWRAKVRAEAARKSRKLEVGQTVKLVARCTFGGVEVESVEILSVKPLLVMLPDGRRGKLSRRLLAAEGA